MKRTDYDPQLFPRKLFHLPPQHILTQMLLHRRKMLIVKKPQERLRDALKISAYGGINVPKITQPSTRPILNIFSTVYWLLNAHSLFIGFLHDRRRGRSGYRHGSRSVPGGRDRHTQRVTLSRTSADAQNENQRHRWELPC